MQLSYSSWLHHLPWFDKHRAKQFSEAVERMQQGFNACHVLRRCAVPLNHMFSHDTKQVSLAVTSLSSLKVCALGLHMIKHMDFP